MKCISINYKNAPEAVRKLFSFSEEEKGNLVAKLHCIILNTCNRTEIYTPQHETFANLEKILAEKSGLQETEVKKFSCRFQDENAIKHLCKVACGLDSMVIGENEILGQVKEAYNFSCNKNATDYELNTVFKGALFCAKKTKTKTEISKSPLSIATIASNKISEFIAENNAPHNISALIIGSSGKMGNIILKNLLEKDNVKIFATKRTHGFSQENNSRINIIDYGARYNYIDSASVIISATESPHYTLTKYEAEQYLKTDKMRLFVDIAVPSDIDEAIKEIYNCNLINIDDFEQLAKENNLKKQKATIDANVLIEKELDYICNKLSLNGIENQMERIKTHFNKIPFEKVLCLLKNKLDSKSFNAMLKVLKEEID